MSGQQAANGTIHVAWYTHASWLTAVTWCLIFYSVASFFLLVLFFGNGNLDWRLNLTRRPRTASLERHQAEMLASLRQERLEFEVFESDDSDEENDLHNPVPAHLRIPRPRRQRTTAQYTIDLDNVAPALVSRFVRGAEAQLALHETNRNNRLSSVDATSGDPTRFRLYEEECNRFARNAYTRARTAANRAAEYTAGWLMPISPTRGALTCPGQPNSGLVSGTLMDRGLPRDEPLNPPASIPPTARLLRPRVAPAREVITHGRPARTAPTNTAPPDTSSATIYHTHQGPSHSARTSVRPEGPRLPRVQPSRTRLGWMQAAQAYINNNNPNGASTATSHSSGGHSSSRRANGGITGGTVVRNNNNNNLRRSAVIEEVETDDESTANAPIAPHRLPHDRPNIHTVRRSVVGGLPKLQIPK